MLNQGDKINNYTLEKYLGKGSYGEVWLAKKSIELSDDGILVALKFLGYQPQKDKTQADFIKQVKREVGTWIKASGHKNIVSVQDGFAFRDDTFVIVSDFAEGGSLGDWLQANGGKSPGLEKTVEVMLEILDGLAHLHSQNPDKIIHRDLKPDNVLFKSGVPCITDFGVSRMSQTITQSMANMAATSAGTPLYMSPESFNNQPASRSMDIWSAGVILYQMLSGDFPYYADNMIALAMEIISGNPPKPLPNDVPSEFRAIVAKALEKNVLQRFQTAEEMKARLKNALKRLEMSQYQPILTQPVQPKLTDTIIDEDFQMPIQVKRPPAEIQSHTFKNSIGMEFVLIPAGSFMMGSPSSEIGRKGNETQHRVTISRDFYMGKYEVTQAQWKAIMGNNPSNFKGDNLPVEQVSWEDAQEFIKKLNAKGEGTYRLPTESEWEYACRAGTTGDYAGNLDAIAWYWANSGSKIHEVRTKKANAWGLYDMHGNAWEWCQDWYGAYPSGAVTSPMGATSGSYRVNRGGSWCSDAVILRSASRNRNSPSYCDIDLGFRLVREN